MKKKKELIISMLGIISLLLVTVGISVAFFSYAKEGVKENAVTTGSITFLYTEVDGVGNGISIADAFPMSDEVGKLLTKEGEYFDFKITSNMMSYVSVPYEVTARKSSDSTLSEEAVRIYLTELEETEEKEILIDNYSNLIQTSKVSEDKYTEKTIYTDTVPINTESYEKSFRLRMWLDENIDYSSGNYNGKTFSLTVNVYANNSSDIDTSKTTNPKDTSVSSITANSIYLFEETEEEGIDYTLTVPSEVETIDITVTPNNMHATASVEQVESIAMLSNIKRLSTASNLGLESGENYFKAIITSSDKTKTQDYILKVIKEVGIGETWSYNYTGGMQSFTAPTTGVYKFELYGASGGKYGGNGNAGGTGGYVYGHKLMTSGETLYLCVGGKGTDGKSSSTSNTAGGYNGGGRGGPLMQAVGVPYTSPTSGGGGGATSLSTANTTIADNMSACLLIAGGGGGGGAGGTGGRGGGAGGTTGAGRLGSSDTNQTAPTSTAKGKWLSLTTYGYVYSSAGQGINAGSTNLKDSTNTSGYLFGNGGGGGGGRYGGSSGPQASGSGGSAYIGGMPDFAYNEVTYSSGYGTSSDANSGNGKAIITLVAK